MKKTVVVFVVMLVLLFQNGMDVEAKESNNYESREVENYKHEIDESINKNLIVVEYRQIKGSLDEQGKIRKIADYIGGMMDTYAIETYKKIFGKSPFDIIYTENK